MSEQLRKPNRIFDDTRKISAIHFDDVEGSSFTVGTFGITAIVAYRENGEMDNVPWLAIYKGDDIYQRLPANRVRIVYEGFWS